MPLSQPVHVSQHIVPPSRGLVDRRKDLPSAALDVRSEDAREAEHRARCEQLAHDLRSSLAAASFAAELLENARNDPEQVDSLAESIKEALDRTQRIIKTTLATR